MRTFHLVLFGILLNVTALQAQVGINSTGSAPDQSAMLDVSSSTKGFLTPRMTYTEMGLIPNPASGLTVFCTTHGQYYINRGTPAAPEWVSTVSLPFLGFLSTNQPIFSVTNYGLGYGGIFVIDNPSSSASAIYASTNGPGWTIAGFNTGSTDGFAGYFRNTSPTNTWPAIQGKTAGEGSVFRAYQNLGPGPGMDVFMLFPTSTAPGIAVDQQALGNAGQFIINNPASTSHAVYGATNGGTSIYAHKTGGSQNEALLAINESTGGFGMQSLITNPSNGWPSLTVGTAGTGSAGEFAITNATSGADAITALTGGSGSAISANNSGTGRAIWGEAATGEALHLKNASSVANTMVVENNGSTAAMWATAGEGNALVAINQSSSGEAIWAQNNGSATAIGAMATTGSAIYAFNHSPGSPTIQAENNGNAHAIYAVTNGSGTAIQGVNQGSNNGFAGFFSVENVNNNYPAVQGATAGAGSVFRAMQTTGTGPGVDVFIYNPTSVAEGIKVDQLGLGNAGQFIINKAESSATGLYAETNGTGTSFIANHDGSSGNVAIFRSSGSNQARIDKTGKGFFNGGTQTGGADLAEMFDVEGHANDYEPGDVMVISEKSDRTMEKSTEAVSTRVAGVYATKPGVVLTEMGIDENLDALVPVGVVGVIPTKVCDENGPIKRGDLLVTSSTPGHAMKAVPVEIKGVLIYPSGAILGKALENFENGKSGLIKVLVNVK